MVNGKCGVHRKHDKVLKKDDSQTLKMLASYLRLSVN
jgi:hypothetical protein